MLFTTLSAILCIHSFVLTYPYNSTNSTASNTSIGNQYPDVVQCPWDCRDHTKYREICDTVCSNDTNKVYATCLFLCDIHHRNGT
uniref:Hypotheticial protein n=1 Tax=Schistosoma japonicum TaxID=6182 RepID=C1LTS2_SCHJA|nr:hypotheticial protein [Schistosoma japonicum]